MLRQCCRARAYTAERRACCAIGGTPRAPAACGWARARQPRVRAARAAAAAAGRGATQPVAAAFAATAAAFAVWADGADEADEADEGPSPIEPSESSDTGARSTSDSGLQTPTGVGDHDNPVRRTGESELASSFSGLSTTTTNNTNVTSATGEQATAATRSSRRRPAEERAGKRCRQGGAERRAR